MTATRGEVRGTTRIAAVLGWPIEHSRSPQLHNAAFGHLGIDAVLVPIAVAPEHLGVVVSALRAAHVLGASVTVPHKLAVAAMCDDLDAAARAIGAVNCLQLVDGRWIGHNTDAAGFADGLVEAGFDLKGKRCVLLGAGGAARAVAYGLREARAIEVVARRPSDVGWAPAWPWIDEHVRDAFSRADLVVDCTPVGLAPGAEEDAWLAALPLDALRPDAWIATLVYHRATRLVSAATGRGHRTLDGRAMLVHQAARAFELWTGTQAPLDVMAAALVADLAGPTVAAP